MVHFVGAGCGAADLITVRGAKLLEAADTAMYGDKRRQYAAGRTGV